MSGKRGMSGIVTTVIMIVLVMVAIGIVWGIVSNILSESAEDISLGTVSVNLNIEKVKVNENDVEVQVKRNAGEADLIGINFLIGDGQNVVPIKQETTMGELSTVTFILPYAGAVKTVEIAPILTTESGAEKILNPIDKEEAKFEGSCLSILNNKNIKKDGIYVIDPDGLGQIKEFEVYCDMTTDGGGWTLLDNFVSSLPDDKDIYGKAIGSSNIKTKDNLISAGYSAYLTTIEATNYRREKGYLQMFYGGAPIGYIEKELPLYGKEVRVSWGNWHNVNSQTSLTIGGIPVQNGISGPSKYIGTYKTGDKIKFQENGIFWVNSIWIR